MTAADPPKASAASSEYGNRPRRRQGRKAAESRGGRGKPSKNRAMRYMSDDKNNQARVVEMNAPSEMSFEEMLRVKLEVLRREHRDLDEAIHALETTGRPDQLTLRRLKKQKLALKDSITRIEDKLIPDIIA
jgi:hypothetical protein